MAEVVGIAASIVTLTQLIGKLSTYAKTYRNTGNEVETCRDVLEGVVLSIKIIERLSSGHAQALVLPASTEEQTEKVVEVLSEKIKSLIEDVEGLLKKLKRAKSIRKSLKNLGKRLFSGPHSSGIKVRPQHISDLVRTAKDLEGSLHFAFSTLIYEKMGASQRDWQQTFQDLIERFEQSQRTWRTESSPIGVYNRSEAENSTAPQPLQDASEEQGGSGDETSRISFGTLIPVDESANMSDDLRNEIEIEIAELFNHGRLVPHLPNNSDEAQETSPAEYTSESETEDIDTPVEIESVSLTHEPRGPDVGEECTVFRDGATNISRSGRVFLDEVTNVASCKSSDINSFRFCIHTLIVLDDGKFNAMVREPCSLTGTSCDHISIFWSENSLDSMTLPASIDVTVRHGQILPSADLADQAEQAERADALILHYSLSCLSEDTHTLIWLLQGACKRYAAPNSITVVQSWLASGRNEDPVEEEELNSNIRWDNEESQDGNDQIAVRCGIRDYTVVPCFFCGSDALQPAVSAQGAWAVFIYHNQSIGYNCSRCNKRTWVSGGEFTLTVAGGTWWVGS